MTEFQPIATHINNYLKFKGWTQSYLAKHSGFALSTVKSWLGGNRLPKVSSLECIYTEDPKLLEEAKQIVLQIKEELKEKESFSVESSVRVEETLPKKEGVPSEPPQTQKEQVSPYLSLETTFPSMLFSKTDRLFFERILPSGPELLNAKKQGISYLKNRSCSQITPLCSHTMEDYYQDRYDYRLYKIKECFQLGEGGPGDLFTTLVNLPQEVIEYCQEAKDGFQLFCKLPCDVQLELLDQYLWLKGGAYAQAAVDAVDNVYIHPSYISDLYKNRPWFLSLEQLYQLCKLACTGPYVLAEWEGVPERTHILWSRFNHSPEGLYNWAYFEQDGEHDCYFPQSYQSIITSLLFHNTIPVTTKNKLFLKITNRMVFQKVISLTEKGRQFMAWYEESAKNTYSLYESILPQEDYPMTQNTAIFQEDMTPRFLVGQNTTLPLNESGNVVIVGRSASGKTKFLLQPNLEEATTNYIVTDPKFSLAKEMTPYLLEHGYRVKVVSFDTKKEEIEEMLPNAEIVSFNPFSYLETDYDILAMAEAITASINGAWFELTCKHLLACALHYFIHHYPHEQLTLPFFYHFLATRLEDTSSWWQTIRSVYSENAEALIPSICKSLDSQPEKTLASAREILCGLLEKCLLSQEDGSSFFPEEDTLNISDCFSEKTAMFIGFYPYMEQTPFINMLLSQILRTSSQREFPNLPTQLFLEEFFNLGTLEFVPTFAAISNRKNLFLRIICMELEQLRGLYNKENADILLSCMKHFVFLSVDTPEAKQFVSKRCKTTLSDTIKNKISPSSMIGPQLPSDKLVFLANGKPPILDSKISLQKK